MSNNQQNSDQYHPNFEELLNLAKNDPAQFEVKRLEYIELFFTKVPDEKQRRLRGLQWQIDQARQLARTPMASCLNIMNQMWDSLSKLNDEQRTLSELATTPSAATQKPATYFTAVTDNSRKGEIIPFPTR